MFEFLRKLWNLSYPYRFRLATGVFFGIAAGAAEPLLIVTAVFVLAVIFPGMEDTTLAVQLQKHPAIQKVIAAAQHLMHTEGALNPKMVIACVVMLIPAVVLVRGLVGYLNAYLMGWVAVRAIADLRTRIFNHLLNLPLAFFSKVSTGELMSRVGDVAVLQGLIANSLAVIVKDPMTILTCLFYLLSQEPKLTLLSLIVFPIFILPISIYSRKVRHSGAAIQSQAAELNRLMYESFTGNRIIKAYNLEGSVVESFIEETRKFIGHYMRALRSTEIPGPLIEFFGAVGVALILIFVATGKNQRPPADFFIFVGFIFSMYRPIKSVVRLHSQLEQARAATERVFQLLATPTTVLEPVQPKTLQAAQADIHFDGIDFDYGEKPVLRGIQLTVKAGQLVALVGSSGSGKTTLTNLLLRFYDPQKGAVRIGGIDIRDVLTRDLRSQIAVVTQDTFLFNDTIRNNISMSRPGPAAHDAVEAAARHAFAHQFILEKEKGYDSIVGERGVELSGGQRQRLAIARAIFKDAPILILDEATSSLDSEAERSVQVALEKLMQGRTTICIAHRLSTIQSADLIVVLEQGRIVETGRHAELLQRGGLYKKLFDLQFQV